MVRYSLWDFIVVFTALSILTGLTYGLHTVLTSEEETESVEKYNASAEFTIENIDFVVAEDIGYNSYGRYVENTETIYIKSGRSLHKMKDTCEHEILHYRGLDAEDSEDHEYIYRNQGNVNSDICIRFIYELGRWNAKN